LMDREYLEEIETGVNSYYVIGEFLRTKYDITSLVDKLKQEAENGTLSQTSLSNIISVDAKEDVIKYLETTKGVILDLGGNFLILDDESIESFAEARADEIKDTIDQTLEKKWHILTVEELQGYIEENLESRQNSDYPEALQRAETLNMREDIFEKTVNHIEKELDLETRDGLYIRDGFENKVDEKANQAVEEAEGDSPTSAENWEDLAMTKLNKSGISSSPSVVNHFEARSRDRIQSIIDSKMGGGE